MVRQAKVTEEHRVVLASHDNPKEFFGYVNKHTLCSWLMGIWWQIVWKLSEISKSYFSYIFTVKDVDRTPDPVNAGEKTLIDIDCSKPQIQLKLKPDKAAGPDGFRKKSSQSCSKLMARSCTSARPVTTAEEPLNFRSMDICPIPKKGLLMETRNYKRISLTSIAWKALECPIRDGVANFPSTSSTPARLVDRR